MSRIWFNGGNWNMGKDGFRWESASVPTSMHIKFNNIYREQNTDVNGWGFYIDAHVQNISWDQVSTGSTGKGWYLRRNLQPTLLNSWHNVASVVGFDIDNTVRHFKTINTYFQQTATFNTTGMTMFYGYGSTGSKYQSQFWDRDETYYQESNGVFWTHHKPGSMDNNTTFRVPVIPQYELARINVTAMTGAVANQLYQCDFLYGRSSGTEVVRLVNDNASVCAATNETGGTDGKISVDIAAGNQNVYLVNKIGSTLTNVFVTVEGIQ
jgi:hypothetical protein